jgi:hypothetical protein
MFVFESCLKQWRACDSANSDKRRKCSVKGVLLSLQDAHDTSTIDEISAAFTNTNDRSNTTI